MGPVAAVAFILWAAARWLGPKVRDGSEGSTLAVLSGVLWLWLVLRGIELMIWYFPR